MPLHVGFGRRLTEDVGIDVDEGQILALLFGEALWAATRWPHHTAAGRRPKHHHPRPTSRPAYPRVAPGQLVKTSVTSY
jgi:hypothetical protein